MLIGALLVQARSGLEEELAVLGPSEAGLDDSALIGELVHCQYPNGGFLRVGVGDEGRVALQLVLGLVDLVLVNEHIGDLPILAEELIATQDLLLSYARRETYCIEDMLLEDSH